VPQLVERRLDAQPDDHPVVALGDAVRRQEGGTVGHAREQECVGRQLEPQRGCAGPTSLDVLTEHRDRLGIKRNPPLLVGALLGDRSV